MPPLPLLSVFSKQLASPGATSVVATSGTFTAPVPVDKLTGWPWQPPEVLQQLVRLPLNSENMVTITPAADIYAFGILMGETACWNPNYAIQLSATASGDFQGPIGLFMVRMTA
jgi:hypothetical protein